MTTTGVDDSPDRSQGTYDEAPEEEVFQVGNEEVSQVGDDSHYEDDPTVVATVQYRTPGFIFPRPDPATQGRPCTSTASTPDASRNPASTPSTSSHNLGPPSFTLTDDQFKVWMQFQASQQKITNEPVGPAPCVGGTSRQGYWVGFSLNRQGCWFEH